jgi:hypothetical protein
MRRSVWRRQQECRVQAQIRIACLVRFFFAPPDPITAPSRRRNVPGVAGLAAALLSVYGLRAATLVGSADGHRQPEPALAAGEPRDLEPPLPCRRLRGFIEVLPKASEDARGNHFTLKINSKLQDRHATRQRMFQTLRVGLNIAGQRGRHLVRAAHSTKIA